MQRMCTLQAELRLQKKEEDARIAETVNELVDVAQLTLKLVDPLALVDLLGQGRRDVIRAVVLRGAFGKRNRGSVYVDRGRPKL